MRVKRQFSVLLSYIAVAITGLTAVSASALEYQCEAVWARSPGANLKYRGVLNVKEARSQDEHQRGARMLLVTGHIGVDFDYSHIPVGKELCYQAGFENVLLTENRNYNPEVYHGYSQFKRFIATRTSECDGGGMGGELLIEKNIRKRIFLAHYIFRAGDHMGGTVDFVCKRARRD